MPTSRSAAAGATEPLTAEQAAIVLRAGERVKQHREGKFLSGSDYNIATSILGQFARYGRLTPRQWKTLDAAVSD